MFTVANDLITILARNDRTCGRRVFLPTNETSEGICLVFRGNVFKRSCEFSLYLKPFCKKSIKFSLKLTYEHVS